MSHLHQTLYKWFCGYQKLQVHDGLLVSYNWINGKRTDPTPISGWPTEQGFLSRYYTGKVQHEVQG
jgi:hypothetical protein